MQITISPVAEDEMKKIVLRVEQVSVKALVNPAAYSSWVKLLRRTLPSGHGCILEVDLDYHQEL